MQSRRSGRIAKQQSAAPVAVPPETPQARNKRNAEGAIKPRQASQLPLDDEEAAGTLATPSTSKKVPGGIDVTDDEEYEKEEDEEEYDPILEGEDDSDFEEDDDPDFEGDDVDHLELDGAEVPPEEVDEEEYDDDEESESSERSNKRARLSSETAEDWIRRYNIENPVDENDPDMKRFQHNMSELITTLCAWAKDSTEIAINAWMRLDAADRAITRPFRAILIHANCEKLIQDTLDHIPDKAQQILGKPDLQPIDLLDLPEVPKRFQHRLVYTNMPVNVGVNNVVQGHSQLTNRQRLVKTLKPGTTIDDEMDIGAYFGSSIAQRGGYTRLITHENNANSFASANSKQYTFTRQAGVVPNFRIIGVWSNPHVVESMDPNYDVERWMPVFLEGLLMVYLGLLHRRDRPSRNFANADLFTEPKYKLIDHLRNSMNLPDLHQHSLNSAWPLAQGVNGGMRFQKECGNPACKRSHSSSGKKLKFAFTGGLRICPSCCSYYAKRGFHRESFTTYYDKALGPRTCCNPNCGQVEDFDDKKHGHYHRDKIDPTKYRCGKCYDWLRHRNEERPFISPTGPKICLNANCGLADDNKKGWKKDEEDPTKYRCPRCARYYGRHSREWGTPQAPREPRVCLNCGNVEDAKNKKWCKDEEDPSKWRCGRCWIHRKNHPGTEWSPPELKVCFNINCGKLQDPEDKKTKWLKDKEDPSQFRCSRCHSHCGRYPGLEWPDKE